MKLSLTVLSALVVSGLLACGGTEAVEALEPLAQEESALETCTTTCSNGSTVSCTGTTCNTYPGESVECDGLHKICPISLPSICLQPNSSCLSLAGKACSPAGSGTRSCCINRRVGNCFCTIQGVWACSAN
ncbi:hypothetical protein HUA74_30375 [Myxococcus sp. CA051A]|uniref:Lipoprotein n=1 Tax=Myxococcus llanfairpwllgwyngyllgogerychwyrndrobwllllantysiliogogogochensis TaxID=2590453 RepID=A0A540X0D1_9BACT|nr:MULTISPECIES: hypothetical protein [Myxococcus]NTX06373.1 hypothetical protein [Myxococcus sp. CA040A]NTX09631.1 hypothetical protein [Myxococcus sp. CA056]NTX34995.1 hypothetical protein [Myxococcus sp. CA033]NTX58135.1 hypothetical protein [Myxococcus sp. CA039A]NTX64969.1 hypothetical protein [Myxococcus sp. CA051A]